MPSSTTHNFVRTIQLCLSISLTATAAFLLHYRTKAHANFTNEPLASCVAGAVAFIYALWAILNHRRQPDKHQWIYLHALGCFVVCGLLIAGATLAIIFGLQGVPCQKLQEAHDYVEPGSSSVRQGQDANLIVRVSHPEFHDDETYAPGQICENYYADMDKACAVLGIAAALFWVADFCLIFGFCGSKGRYGPHREYRRRGQVSPDDDDDIEGDNRDSAYGGSRDREFEPQEDYYDTLDGRKRNLERIEHNTREDPMRHVQGPIPMSMQTSYFSGNDSSDMKSVDQNNNPVTIVTAATPGSDQQLSSQHDCQTPPSISLNPPPRAQWRLIPTPDSPTLPPMTASSSQSTLQLDSYSQEESTKPAPVRLPSDIADALAPKPTQPRPIHTQSAPSQTETKPYVTLQLSGPTPALVAVAVAGTAPSEPTSQDAAALPTSSSPRYTEFPAGPACYVFDSCNHEYLPSYVNQAARNEKQQQILKTSSAGVNKEKSLPSTPRGGTPPSVSAQILVTGLGLEVITRSDTQISAEEKEAMELAKQQQQQRSMMASSVIAVGSGQKASSPGKAERPKKIILPNSNPPHRPHGTLSSYFPSAPASPASSTTSIRSFMSAKGQDLSSLPSSASGSQTSPNVKQAHMGKKPSLTKRRSKLSVVTQRKTPDNGSERGGEGVQEAEPNKARSMSMSMSPLSSSPSSPYIGDF